MAKVKAYVYVTVGGGSALLRPGDDVPAGVTVTNPDVLDGPAPEQETPKAPAKATPRKTAPAKS